MAVTLPFARKLQNYGDAFSKSSSIKHTYFIFGSESNAYQKQIKEISITDINL